MNQTVILLVEDNESDAELAIRALKKNDAQARIIHVTDGPAALDYVFSEGNYSSRNLSDAPGIVLLDLKLPKLNGLEVLKAIKQDHRHRSLPVIMLTSSREISDVEMAYALGVNSYIVKPMDFENFVDTIKNIGHYWVSVNQSPQAV